MSTPTRSKRRPRALPVITALALAASALPALAQGTKEQREACTADAISLCQDTIPDVDKTTACMKQHIAELSPKCRAEVAGLDAAPPPDSQARVPDPGGRDPGVRDPTAEDEQTGSLPPVSRPGDEADEDDALSSYRRSIARSCRQGLIDPFTCRNTMRALNAGR